MMNALLLLLTISTSTIVLRSGDRIAADGPVRSANGVVTFWSAGLLYSVPAAEVEQIRGEADSSGNAPVRRLRVSEEERKRLIAALEDNHSGTPAPPRAKSRAPIEVTPEPEDRKEDEAWWRSQARAHEENVRRAKEELELLQSRAAQLEDQIRSFLILGYVPREFTYQTTQLEWTRERIPHASLEVTRAERVWQQFREDARRAGVLPGWLR